jgi:hypothetical protein
MTDCINMNNICVSSKNLTKVFLRNCSTISDETVKSISKTCPNVKFLEIFNCSGVQYPLIDCEELTDLHFTKCENLVKPTLKCSKLKKLIFKQCPKMKDLNVQHKESSSMEVLFSECFEVDDSIVESLKSNGIQTLVFSKCHKLVKPNIDFENLKQLRFVDCNSLQSPLVSSSTLSVLSFHDCKSLNFTKTSEMLLQTVDTLEFVNCGAIVNVMVDSEVRKLSASFCQKLEKLFIWNSCTVKSKITLCPNLTTLMTVAKSLKELSIKDCESLESMTQRECESLKQIEMMNCTAFSDLGLHNILTKCQQLNHLEMSNCGIVSPSISHSTLNTISLSNCKVESFTLDCENLTKLKLADCHQFASEIKTKNIEKLKELEVSNTLFNANLLADFLAKAESLASINLKKTGMSSKDISYGNGLKNRHLNIVNSID